MELKELIHENLTVLKSELTSIYVQAPKEALDETTIKNRILEVMFQMKKTLQNPKSSSIKVIKPILSNCSYDQKLYLSRDKANLKYEKVQSKTKLLFLVQILAKILQLFSVKSVLTKRAFYYHNRDLVGTMGKLENALRFISSLIDVPVWDLCILPTTKGVIAGSLKMKCKTGTFSCSNHAGLSIPQDILRGVTLTTEAKFILVVEKYASFQKIIDENFLERYGPCILLTAKGFPDLSTRAFLKLLWDQLSIPIFCLVDADPHGIEIMTVYRFGSLNYVHLSDLLAVPSMRWIGIHPSDVRDLVPCTKKLTECDISKARDLLKKPFVTANEELKHQINLMLRLGVKSGIEGIGTISNSYLSDVYIPMKLNSKTWI